MKPGKKNTITPLSCLHTIKKKSLKLAKSKKIIIKENKVNLCSICLDSIPESNLHFLPCCHYFHKECIDTWLELKVTCPECRVPIFIQTHYQLHEYKIYLDKEQSRQSLMSRYGIATNDDSVSLMFMRDPNMFHLEAVESTDLEKFRSIIYYPEPAFRELYADVYTGIPTAVFESDDPDNIFDDSRELNSILNYIRNIISTDTDSEIEIVHVYV